MDTPPSSPERPEAAAPVKAGRLRRMTPEHIPRICEIHRASWGANEVSAKLGEQYLRLFYGRVVSSRHSFGFVYLADGKMVGYASAFHDYARFNAELRSSHTVSLGIIALRRLVAGSLSVGDLRDLFADAAKVRKVRHPSKHWGATALANEYKRTRLGKEAIAHLMAAVCGELRSGGAGGVWCACDDRNYLMKQYLLRMGFDQVDTVPFLTRTIRVYEKEIGDEALPPPPL